MTHQPGSKLGQLRTLFKTAELSIGPNKRWNLRIFEKSTFQNCQEIQKSQFCLDAISQGCSTQQKQSLQPDDIIESSSLVYTCEAIANDEGQCQTGQEKRLASEAPHHIGLREKEDVGWNRGKCMHERWLQFLQ